MFSATERETRLLRQLGTELRRERLALGERQADFAQRIGVSVPTYRRMEQGCGSVPLGYWVRVLSVLDYLGGMETILQSGRRGSDEGGGRVASRAARKRALSTMAMPASG